MLSVRIVSVDHYMAKPIKEMDPVYSQFRGSEIKQVPVIRIFGSTSLGQKVCLHVHGVFPYLYIPYDTSCNDPDMLMYQILNSIEKGLNISLRNASSTTHHIFKMTLVKGIPFYGYHPKEHKFLKIYFYNPMLIKRAADLLQNSSVLGQAYQPHESHVPFILQFFIDYNLYGMSFINITNVKYRQNNDLELSQEQLLPQSVERMSRSELEIDCLAMHIMNRYDIISGNLAINPGLAAIWENEKTRNKLLNLSEYEASQQDKQVINTKSEVFFKNRLKQILLEREAHSETLNETELSGSVSNSGSILENTIYPEENNDDTLMNASLIDVDQSSLETESKPNLEIILDEQDKKLLDILKDLEENAHIEDDSILGTQLSIGSDSNIIDKGEIEASAFCEDDEHDLSMALSLDQMANQKNDECIENSQTNNIWETSFLDKDDQGNNICNSQEPIKACFIKKEELTSSKCEQTKTNLDLLRSASVMKKENISIDFNELLTITPLDVPLTRNKLISSLDDYNIPECDNIKPFYSNPEDASAKREVGLITLKIPTNAISDLEEFQTCSDYQLQNWRSEMFKEMNLTSEFVNTSAINIFLSSESKCTITPLTRVPNAKEVSDWVKAKDLYLELNQKQNSNKSSIKPIIFKFSIPNSPSEEALNCSLNSSINLSPYTPSSLNHLSPLNEKLCSQDNSSTQIIKKAQHKPKKSKKRLFNKILDESLKKSDEQEDYLPSSENSLSQNSENISSNDTVKLLLEQSEYVRGLISPTNSGNNSEDTIVALNNTHDIHMGEANFKQVKTVCDHQYLTLLCLELHIQTRQDLKPDPDVDPIRAVFYAITNDVPEDFQLGTAEHGVIVVDFSQDPNQQETYLNGINESTKNVIHTKCELDLIQEVINLVIKWDPDILAGYEIEMLSWGFLIQRSSVLGINITKEIHRASSTKHNEKQWGDDNNELITVTGRIMLDIWRLLRHEVALTNYTFENVMYNVLQQRVPKHSFKSLTFWWEHPTALFRWIVVEYYLLRVKGIIKLLDQLDLIGRTCELARLFGIQFYEVLSRGSQFRVESMMLRLAKPLNYVAISPSVQQRAHMRAPEFLPLILEPESRFYNDPVIVLDFQSLYPSMIIAYNYCFSTCLGRVEHLGKSSLFEFGAAQLKVSKHMLQNLVAKDKITISPCGVVFVNRNVRLGVLPRMLQEILDTRLMVKKSMKQNTENKVLQRLLHSQQLGLKLIANVTYGYTAANFSGRMPCIEVGDSVVAKGRETLERAIKLVENTEKWKAKVVYGDTDSMFVLVPGRSREVAFKIGAEIAEAVTNENPHPVKLKLEKVYQPCILQTKKRYVGYMYECPSQTIPVYDAKGIETVRRDGCPAVAKILEKSIRILFETCDVSKVKAYALKKFGKILNGELSLQDLVFAKEFRGLHSYKPGACVPALVLARKWMMTDKRSEPRRSERVPYVIINGLPNTPLIQLVRSPYDLLQDPGLRINAIYYITRVIIPPLNRCLLLIGANAHDWFAEMPRITKQYLPTMNTAVSTSKKSTVSQYFSIEICASCGIENKHGICSECLKDSQKTSYILNEKLRCWEREFDNILKVCKSCCYRHESIECISLDCPTFFRQKKAERNCQQTAYVRSLLDKFL